MINFYEFEIVYYDEDDKKSQIEKGITIGENFAEAMENLENLYGELIEQVNYLRWADKSYAYVFNGTEAGKYNINVKRKPIDEQ